MEENNSVLLLTLAISPVPTICIPTLTLDGNVITCSWSIKLGELRTAGRPGNDIRLSFHLIGIAAGLLKITRLNPAK
jgi:hypothetical protein